MACHCWKEMIEPPADGIGMPQEPFDKIPSQTIDVLRRSKSFHFRWQSSTCNRYHPKTSTGSSSNLVVLELQSYFFSA
jgi:hypothetical protein